MKIHLKMLMSFAAVVAMTFCGTATSHAQGFRIGRVLQAGGGQGFRLGGPRIGMQFGGGQGAIFGAGRAGMRFGNGQGARFYGPNSGVQFGGGQGVQLGPYAAQPGTYYYPQNVAPTYGVPSYATPVAQPYGQNVYQDGSIVNAPQTAVIDGMPVEYSQALPYSLDGTTSETVVSTDATAPNSPTLAPTQADDSIVVAPEVEEELAPADSSSIIANDVVANDPAMVTAPPVSTPVESTNNMGLPATIRLLNPETATSNISFNLSGSDYTLEPGKEMLLDAGNWNVTFSAGEGFEDRSADLSELGTYVFTSTENEGIVLYQQGVAEAVEPGTEAPATDAPAGNLPEAPQTEPATEGGSNG